MRPKGAKPANVSRSALANLSLLASATAAVRAEYRLRTVSELVLPVCPICIRASQYATADKLFVERCGASPRFDLLPSLRARAEVLLLHLLLRRPSMRPQLEPVVRRLSSWLRPSTSSSPPQATPHLPGQSYRNAHADVQSDTAWAELMSTPARRWLLAELLREDNSESARTLWQHWEQVDGELLQRYLV